MDASVTSVENGKREQMLDKRALRLVPLAFTIFCCVSGGPFGLEGIMQSGPGMATLLILVTPIVWAIPMALMTAELASAIPSEGGVYVWVKRALGPFWGFLCGWWTWLYTWVDAALYPVLFSTYVSSLLKLFGYGTLIDDNPWIKWGVGLVMVVPFTWLNIRGTRLVGFTSIGLAALFLLPFGLVVALGLGRLFENPAAAVTPFVPTDQTPFVAMASGLYIVMWNYLGWDDLSTVAGEVENPQRNFPRALLIAVILTILVYLLPILVGAVYVPDYASWDEGTWTTVAEAIGGRWLGVLMVIAGIFSAAALFVTTLLASSRLPFAIAEDRVLPGFITKLHPRYRTPYVAILISAAVYTVLSFQSFENLVKLDVIVDSFALALEFVALVVLRIKEPDLPRPFKIPGGWIGLGLVALLPMLVAGFAIFYSVRFDEEYGGSSLTLAAIGLATGPIVYAISKFVRRS